MAVEVFLMIKKKLSYILSCIFLMISLLSLFDYGYGTIFSIIFAFLALIVSPLFTIMTKLINRRFSITRRFALGIGTFCIPILSYITSYKIEVAIILLYFYWIIMIITDKNKFSDPNNNALLETINKKGWLYNIYNHIIERHNQKVLVEIEKKQKKIETKLKIIKTFSNIDILTAYSLSKMLKETKEKYNSVFNEGLPKINIGEVIISFCQDVDNIDDETSLNNLYNTYYYKSKISQHFKTTQQFIKNKIKPVTVSNDINQVNILYNKMLDILCKSMNYFEVRKFLNSTTNIEYNDKSTELELDYRYKDAFLYLFDAMATCTCIAKIFFIEKKLNAINKDSEFYKIINNMSREFEDINLIIEKIRPIYNEFYKSQLGFISDDLLFKIAITIMLNKIRSSEISEKEQEILNIGDRKIISLEELNNVMNKWIYDIASNNKLLDIHKYVVQKILGSINKYDFDLLIDALFSIDSYCNLYYKNISFNNKLYDKNRYLNGDFEKEKKEIYMKYELNNIETGYQFEIYLERLFKDLGYKTIHTGKTGDQGADLILKWENKVYAVQAKYYTGKLTNTPIQEVVGALKYYNANQGVVVTNSSFTSGAKDLAKANNVILIDEENLKKLTDYAFDNIRDKDILQNFIMSYKQ